MLFSSVMAKLTFQSPTDQPTGKGRLLKELRDGLTSSELTDFRIVVAFAKLGPLARLESEIVAWRKSGRKIRAIVGIDHRGTSYEALEFVLTHFDESRVARIPGGAFSPTFHPKIYLFTGDDKAIAFIGSNNLTVGGTESNAESHIKLELSLPADQQVCDDIVGMWDDAMKMSLPLTAPLLNDLHTTSQVLTEKQMRAASKATSTGSGSSTTGPGAGTSSFPQIPLVPPSALPKTSLASPSGPKAAPGAGSAGGASTPASAAASTASTLVIQIVPHHNGEVFLSKTAVDQNPAFFGWPFTGSTTPKNAGNRSYPQRLPDPIVDIILYDSSGHPSDVLKSYGLNTVFYDVKSEIRITITASIAAKIPDYSIMVMSEAIATASLDYSIEIYPPGSPQYARFLVACNQAMPSGGKPNPRKFGWL